MGGLPPNSTGRTAGILVWEAAMSLYEILDLALRVIQLGIDIIQRLLRRRKKGKRVKNSPPCRIAVHRVGKRLNN